MIAPYPTVVPYPPPVPPTTVVTLVSFTASVAQVDWVAILIGATIIALYLILQIGVWSWRKGM